MKDFPINLHSPHQPRVVLAVVIWWTRTNSQYWNIGGKNGGGELSAQQVISLPQQDKAFAIWGLSYFGLTSQAI